MHGASEAHPRTRDGPVQTDMRMDGPQVTAADAAIAMPSHEALQQAAEWFALLRSGAATRQDHAAWQHWLDCSSEHRGAWQYVESISRRFNPLRTGTDPRPAVNALQTLGARRRQRRRWLKGMVALAGVGLLGGAMWRQTPLAGSVLAWGADYRSARGEIREIVLADHTRIWLNTASAFDVDYRPGLRRVRLVAGEMLIKTAADAMRPFVAETCHGSLRALGTRFTVRLTEGSTFLAVYEGAVELRTADTRRTRVIAAGEQVGFTAADIAPPEVASRAREAWAQGVLLAEDIPLRELVAELGRYRTGHLGVSPAVAGLRVLGGYPLQDSDKALAMLESVLPIEIRRTLPWWVSIEARQE